MGSTILRRVLRAFFGRRCLCVTGEAGLPFRFRPAEYPSLLRGPGRVDRHLRQQWSRLLRPGEVIFDIGANIGVTVQRFYSILNGNCRIWAFEPIPRNVELLRWNTQHLPADRVQVLACAIGDHDGEVTFYDNVEHGALSRQASTLTAAKQRSPDFWRTYREVRVRLVALDTFLDEHPDARPTFLKIDVEGAAASVLQGAAKTLRACKPVVTCEFHSEEERSGVVQQLASLGYRGIVFHEGRRIRWCPPAEASGHFVHPADPRVPELKPEPQKPAPGRALTAG